ncbi:MMPL family transporter [Streptomyces tubbatahanensis]|uniref:MMPL family transporter n=1 Tax=Streptomyces tubbatahanensis TaxID=2923272 RepID=A0ABY3XZP2_9ACTN|nr:MMPL family transporter [Streptomyces tubbatahanensis]UNT00021.1 MMPL family transporter [Streptomyces tubbatahanensis]
MLDRTADFTYRRARTVLLLALLAVVALAAVGSGAFGKLKGGGFDDPASPSSRAAALIEEKFGGQNNLVLLVSAEDGDLEAPAVERAGEKLTRGLRAEPGVSQVTSYWAPGGSALTSRDGDRALVLAHMDDADTERITEVTDEWTGVRGPVSVQAGGPAALNGDITAQVSGDLALAEAIAVPVTLVLLIVAFGSVVAALLPLAIGVVAILGTFAELYVLGSITDVSVFAVNLTTALGLGLGIDYGLLLVSRFRERLGAGDGTARALRTTVRTAGRTILFSAATVVAALAALLLFPPFFLRSFAYAGIGVVAIAALAALLIVPALLAVLGERVNKGRLPWADAVRRTEAPLWRRMAATVMRRPALTGLPVLAVLLLAASPLLGATFGSPDERVLPESAESRQVSTVLQQDFAGNDAASIALVTEESAPQRAVARYAADVSKLEGVVRVRSATGTWAAGHAVRKPDASAGAFERDGVHRLTVTTKTTPASGAAADLVRDIRAMPGPDGAHVLVGGQDAALIDSKTAIADKLPAAVLWVLGSTFVLLFLFTGSLVQPLRALVLNAVSLTAAIGAMVWIFQDGHLSSALGFTAMPMDTSMTVLMFCIVFGLSMDYEVFVTSRIKELHDAGTDDREAVAGGLSRTGRIVTMAAGLLAVSFFAFATSQISFLQMFGLGSGLAILIDAVAVRGVLVPAAMRLLGRTAWYAPGPLRRLHARVGLSESDPGKATEDAFEDRSAHADNDQEPVHSGV